MDLPISRRAVQTHGYREMRKLGVNRREDAAAAHPHGSERTVADAS